MRLGAHARVISMEREKIVAPKTVEQLNEKISDELVATYLRMDPGDVSRLRDSIERAGGHVVFMVHPFHNKNHPDKLIEREYPDTSYVGDYLFSYLKLLRKRPNMSPLFIFDSAQDALSTKMRVRFKNWFMPGKDKVVFVETLKNSGIPVMDSPVSMCDEDKQFEMFGNVLYSLDVKSVVLAGMYVDHCIGDMRVGIEKRGFETLFSRNVIGRGVGPLTAQTRRDIRKRNPLHPLA